MTKNYDNETRNRMSKEWALEILKTLPKNTLSHRVHLIDNQDGTYSINAHQSYEPCYYCMFRWDDAGSKRTKGQPFEPDTSNVVLAFKRQGLSKEAANQAISDILANACFDKEILSKEYVSSLWEKFHELYP